MGGGQLGAENLDGDGSVEGGVVPEENDAQASGAELALDGEGRSDRIPQAFQQRWHLPRVPRKGKDGRLWGTPQRYIRVFIPAPSPLRRGREAGPPDRRGP